MKTITRLKKITGFSALTLGLLMFASSANAIVLYQWDLFGNYGPGNTNLGTTTTYSSNAYVLGFAGFDNVPTANTPADLLENNRGANEQGLGVIDNNGEVDLDQYIRIDLGTGWVNLDFWEVNFDSLDTNETASLGTTSSGSDILGPVDRFNGQGWLSFVPTAQIIYFNVGSTLSGSTTDDVLLQAIKARTPEPGTLIMMALALGLMGFSRRNSV